MPDDLERAREREQRWRDHMVDRIKMARRLLEWWEATNHPDDHDTGLAIDTRRWLAYMDVEVPVLAKASDLYATLEADEPEPVNNKAIVLSHAHELHHAQLRRMGVLNDHLNVPHKELPNKETEETEGFHESTTAYEVISS